ncbi:hypothetical protein [Parasitella parasitica]|uniref:Uncharacterized protein n=1 Tax=Parasitella parasitica TaxID=35722 RepID=A0A0B7MMK8_9FUNG|nr:hypothetical protein [Parasitella parasitica]
MFHHVSRTSAYQDLLKAAVDLNPKDDYFNFANTVMKGEAKTSSQYITQKKKKPLIIDAIVLFNDSHFYSEEYWRVRDEEEINQTARRIEKRAHEALEQIADNVFDSIVDSSKRIHAQQHQQQKVSLHSPTTMIPGLQILYIDDDGVKTMLDKELLKGPGQQTTLESQHSSSSVTLILTSLNQANPNFYTYRSIKRFNLPENEGFEIFTHADLNFVETMGNHLTIEDYLDPRPPVSIEVLLQEQEEELDQYYGQTDDEDGYHGPKKTSGPLDLNLENTTASFFVEEDAQFLSEHRISAILDDCRKIHYWHQSLLFVTCQKNNPYKVRLQKSSAKRRTRKQSREIPLSSSPQELSSITNTSKPYNSSMISLSASSSSSIASASFPSITHKSEEFVMEHQVTVEKAEPVSPTNAVVPSLSSLSLGNYSTPTNSQYKQPQRKQKHTEFPTTTLSRVPKQPLPPPLHTIPKPQTSASSSTYTQHRSSGRRLSLVTTAQTILGDKPHNFTEKLVFIKRNIIMSFDSDEDEDHYYHADREKTGPAGKSNRNSSSSASLPPPSPPRSSSMTRDSVDKRLFSD